jgi:ABC-type polysaccharide/polyol phosphate export permease
MKSNDSSRHVIEFDASKPPSIIEFLARNARELFVFRHALFNYIDSQLSARYRRSTIGFFWSLLNPLFTMIVMAIVFSSLYKRPFAEFSLYLFSGLLPWNLITASLTEGSMSIVTAEVYLKKIYTPKVLFPLVTLGVEAINFLFSLVSLFLLVLLVGAKISWTLLLVPFALLTLILFLLGLILTLSILTVSFRDMSHILRILLLGLFYMTPILYPITAVADWLADIVKFNPFYYFINLFHLIIYDGVVPVSFDWMVCLILAVVSMLIGITVFHNKEKDVIYRL